MRAEVNKCLEVLSKGGLILYPTDTVWGLVVMPLLIVQ